MSDTPVSTPPNPASGQGFAPTIRSRLKRYHGRGDYSRDGVYRVLDQTLMAHIGYVIDGQPYVTPTCHWRDGDRLYWHGSTASRMLRHLKTGVPVCVNVATLDGLVMARSGVHHSINYRSATCFGTAYQITDREEIMRQLKLFTDRIAPGRWDSLRPVTDQELKATTVLAMEIEEASAKTRTGGPVDDAEDYALPIWARVVPFTAPTVAAPVPDSRLAPGIPLPDHIWAIGPWPRDPDP